MSVDLAHPPPNTTPETAVHISQLAPKYIKRATSSLPWPLSVFSRDDPPEVWAAYETLFLECLRTGDDRSARAILDRLLARFGDKNERVMGYQCMLEEALASNDKDLESVLKIANEILGSDEANVPVQKRRVAVLKSLNRIPEAIKRLTELLDMSPTDAESWAELSDLYLSQGMSDQAIFCLEELLIVQPNAWNMHAKIGEILYASVDSSTTNALELARIYSESMRRFLRSIELCENYLRGYYGLHLTAQKLVKLIPDASKASTKDDAYNDVALPTEGTVQALNEMAVDKLGEIVRKGSAKEQGWDGYDTAELQAARELLDQGTAKVDR
ncbi:tetratricopeptide repeat domain-containing protein [Microthyrium microscopicum]|uniref:ER membrane protein complex subunit 2 n=1 Tax=Microthyrium microscopicum TaxID=703497 RepID=A0A6A6UIW3_9PEZI|nr:tetratricopeptide repeat domain-containing protein [Microthyrium microscopicum]